MKLLNKYLKRRENKIMKKNKEYLNKELYILRLIIDSFINYKDEEINGGNGYVIN